MGLVKDRLGDTVHIRELDAGTYPYQQLINMLVAMDYDGWVLLEAHGPDPDNRVSALTEQRKIFEDMRTKAQQKLTQKSQKVVIANLNR